MTTEWRKGNLGWSRTLNGHSLTVKKYPAWKGRKQVYAYVPRVDNSAPTSPAPAYATLAEAKRVAEEFAKQYEAAMERKTPDFRASIRDAMASQYITQVELAERTGIPQPSISRYLTGARELRTDTLQIIADKLGLELKGRERK